MGIVRPRILIVDDEKRMGRSLEILLREEGPFDTVVATDYYEALQKLDDSVDLVLTDLTMPGKDGLELLRAIKKDRPDTPVLLMTAYSTVQSAVTAMKEGAQDYLVKPFENAELLRLIRKSLGQLQKAAAPESPAQGRFGDIIGASPVMQEVYFRIQRAAETDSTVLITGESGTGKELVARAIHYSGPRKGKPFIALNCSALPETLLETELFGHEKGAFSGAIRQHEGRFELAHTGTLFLDEMAEMSPALQVKLLRVLQERSLERVGGTQTIKVDVRIIAATNRNLAAEVQAGRFREDLFYRINVVTIEMPPLRKRMEDLPLLVQHFLTEKCRKLGLPPKRLTDEAQSRLAGYEFPGNVRELENLIERAIVITREETIEASDLPLAGSPSAMAWDRLSLPIEKGLQVLDDMHAKLERELIERAIRTFPGKSNGELADLLGTSRRVFEHRLKAYQLQKR